MGVDNKPLIGGIKMKTVGIVVVMMIMALSGTSFPANPQISGYITGNAIRDGFMSQSTMGSKIITLSFKGTRNSNSFVDSTTLDGSNDPNDSILMYTSGNHFGSEGWEGTVIPICTGFAFTPESTTYSTTTSKNSDYTVKELSAPKVTVTILIDSEITDSASPKDTIVDTIADSSGQIIKLKYSLSIDSGAFIPVCSSSVGGLTDTTYSSKRSYKWAVAGSPLSIKKQPYKFSIREHSYQVKVETWNPDTILGFNISNTFGTKPATTIKLPIVMKRAETIYGEKIFNARGQAIDKILPSPFSLMKKMNINGQKMILKIK